MNEKVCLIINKIGLQILDEKIFTLKYNITNS